MKGGVPPTLRKARTGEFTPPGINFWARANKASDRERFMAAWKLLSLARNQLLKKDIHHHLLQGAVEVLEYPPLKAEIRLGAGQQVLNESAEARTAPDETDHAG